MVLELLNFESFLVAGLTLKGEFVFEFVDLILLVCEMKSAVRVLLLKIGELLFFEGELFLCLLE